MSRRDSHHSRRIHSKSEREPSPKRSRRDGKLVTERTSSGHNLEIADPGGPDQKHRRRLQDALPLEAPVAPESKTEPDVASKGTEKKTDVANKGIEKTDGLHDRTKNPSDPTEIPRSRSFFQHDERGSAGQGGRSFTRRATERGRWSDSKDRSSDRVVDKVGDLDIKKRDEKVEARADDKSVWRHDGFYELQADAPPSRKRPAFREKKFSPEEGNTTSATATESAKQSHVDRPNLSGARREERGDYRSHGSDKLKRTFTDANERSARTGDEGPRRGEMQSGGYSSRDRFRNGGGFRGRDRFNGRYGETNQNRQGGLHVEKWKHDLFDEANKSPNSKNEEDQIAKVEALLAL